MRNVQDQSFPNMVDDDGYFGLIVRTIYDTEYLLLLYSDV